MNVKLVEKNVVKCSRGGVHKNMLCQWKLASAYSSQQGCSSMLYNFESSVVCIEIMV
jgi:hypothetical protein